MKEILMNDNNVVPFIGETYLDIPADRVLQKAIEARIEPAVVLGRDPEGRLYFASSSGDIADVLLMLEVAKRDLLDEALGDSF